MHKIIVLNKNYEYWKEEDLKKFFKWHAKDKIEIVIGDESKTVGSITTRIPFPFVVRLLEFNGYRIQSESPKYSDQQVFNRDKNICQYWHFNKKKKKFKYHCKNNERTIDHVHPQTLGGKDAFENCVCCCKHHNQFKANKT